VLLLDEPTNHLDDASRSLLIEALARFPGVGLVVSHDRELLARLTTSTLRVEGGRVELWGGTYDVAAADWAAADASRQAELDRAKRGLAKTERRISDRRRTLDTTQAAFARRMRTADAKDHDLHSTAREGKHKAGMAAASKSLGNLAAERDRLAQKVAGTEVRRAVGGRIAFRGRPAPRPVLVTVDGPLSAGGHTLAAHLSCAVERDSRIHLRGPNGAGKSTLLGRLADRWDLEPGRLLHLPQELDAQEGAALLARLRRRPADERGRILQLVARLGTDPDVLLATGLPSPGEARKLAMAMGLGDEAWLLALDEPTNHLDLPTIERLEAALAEYPGALVVVSHDRAFAERVTDETWELSDGILIT
jgi:ATPase subunit of ABC transporter with duplicated ATPase domains